MPVAIAVIGAVGAVGCGAEDFPNEPKPPSPVELTARIDNKSIVVSPTKFDGKRLGAGLANVTISNQSKDDVALKFSGPSDVKTEEILAGNIGTFKLNLEQGNYTVAAEQADLKPMKLKVGPKRQGSGNDLLLP